MDRETGNTRERHGNNGRDYEPLYPYPQHSTAVASDPHQLSGVAELMIAGGLGMAMYMAPNIKDFVQRKFQSIKARTIILRNLLCQTNITSKLRMLYRLRSKGSLVRVIATLLPSQLYAPTRRIYIPDWRAQLDAAAGHSGLILPLVNSRRDDMPTENEVGDGCIEAFEMGSDIVSVSDDELSEDDGSATSTPEGWTKEQQKRLTAQFNPTINTSPDDNISFARCSTPKGSTQNLAFESQITHIGSNYGSNPKLNEDQTTEISELKKIIGGLVLQINTLSESIMASRNQNLTTAEISTGSSQSLDQPVSSTVPPPPSLALPPVPAPKILTATPAGPPPPPPPPPPMPPMPTLANKPLVIVRKGNQDKLIQKKSQVSLSDVLKELPNAKLRRVERSPGGTPIKPLLKLPKDNAQLDMADQLADVLKKRFASMHSPAYDTDTDKENANGSDDSFEDSPISSKPIPTPAKRSLFPSKVSPMKRSSIEKNNENRPTFGQHLLKKRTNVEVGFGKSTNGSPLREQNSSVN